MVTSWQIDDWGANLMKQPFVEMACFDTETPMRGILLRLLQNGSLSKRVTALAIELNQTLPKSNNQLNISNITH